jgi:hypothetical protein
VADLGALVVREAAEKRKTPQRGVAGGEDAWREGGKEGGKVGGRGGEIETGRSDVNSSKKKTTTTQPPAPPLPLPPTHRPPCTPIASATTLFSCVVPYCSILSNVLKTISVPNFSPKATTATPRAAISTPMERDEGRGGAGERKEGREGERERKGKKEVNRMER